jgi:hypothetical protein
MLDHPRKTPQLLSALKAAVPFEVELARPVAESLRSKRSLPQSGRAMSSTGWTTLATKAVLCASSLGMTNKEHSLFP